MAQDGRPAEPVISDSTPVMELVDVYRDYDGGRVRAVAGINLSLHASETTAVIGKSGSGKSTLLHIMAGLDYPTSGSVRFCGTGPLVPAVWNRIRAREVGIVFQAFFLIPTLSALQNVTMPMLGLVSSARERRRRAEWLLERVGLGDRLDHLPGHLSGGERQRVAIARSLANRPRLLLADEPTGNLDSETAEQVLDLIFEVVQETGASLLLVSHDAEIAARTERCITLRDGNIVADQRAGASGTSP